MESMFLASTKLTGGIEIKNDVVNSSQGKNVTLHEILMRTAKNKPANESIIAFWDLDEYTHAILTSDLRPEYDYKDRGDAETTTVMGTPNSCRS